MWYLGVDSGFHSLIRPVLYDAYHEIVNLTRLDAPLTWKVDVVGVICEVSHFVSLSFLTGPGWSRF
jgi:diaminopimelate decarboxylase